MKREFLIAGLGLFALLMLAWCSARMLYPPHVEPTWEPTPSPAATARPTPPPAEDPDPDEEEETPLVVAWCHCGSPYGPCATLKRTWTQVALGHENAETHSHDYEGRCLTPEQEDERLARILVAAGQGRGPGRGKGWAEDFHLWGPGVWAPADRAAYRVRTGQ